MLSDSKRFPHGTQQDVLNGIAYRKEDQKFILTGKLWPRYYVSSLDLSSV